MVRDLGPQAGPRSQMHFDVEAQCILGSHVGNVVTLVRILIVLDCTSQPGCMSFPPAGFVYRQVGVVTTATSVWVVPCNETAIPYPPMGAVSVTPWEVRLCVASCGRQLRSVQHTGL